MDTVKIGILGTGAISHVYLTTLTTVFQNTEVVGVFDLVPERMEQRKQEFNIKKSYHSMDEMLSDPEIEIVVNLTRLDMHYETTKAILMAGKHVYSEKPLASTFSQGQELMRLAKEKGLMLGGAPDTFLGAGFQTARKVIEDGWIGKIVGASAKFLHSGQENWHPAPDFYYMPGGGNMLDMGSYYLTVLVNLMGPVEEVTGMSCKGKETRTLLTGPNYGKTFPVKINTHQTGIMRFCSGAIGTITTSYDTYHDDYWGLEIYGTEGTLLLPDPNSFGENLKLYRAEEKCFKDIPLCFQYKQFENRGLGIADMANALRLGRKMRADGSQMLHILEVMEGFERSSQEHRAIPITTAYEPAAIMVNNELRGILAD